MFSRAIDSFHFSMDYLTEGTSLKNTSSASRTAEGTMYIIYAHEIHNVIPIKFGLNEELIISDG